MAFSPPRIPAHVARGAASEEGEETLALALSFQPSTSILLFVRSLRLAWACSPSPSTDPCRMAAPCMQTDKASMLDEIIDYVKFLQLQVKVMLLLLNIAADEW